MDGLPEDAKDLSFGNSVYKIRFDNRRERPLFGHRYWFYLKDAVDDVPEYIVHWDNFVQYVTIHFSLPLFRSSVVPVSPRSTWKLTSPLKHRMAAAYGLHPVYKKEFHEVFTDNQEHPEFKPLLERMKVVDKDGESQMDEDQWEAASKSPFPPPGSMCIRICSLLLLPLFAPHCSSVPGHHLPLCVLRGAYMYFELRISIYIRDSYRSITKSVFAANPSLLVPQLFLISLRFCIQLNSQFPISSYFPPYYPHLIKSQLH